MSRWPRTSSNPPIYHGGPFSLPLSLSLSLCVSLSLFPPSLPVSFLFFFPHPPLLLHTGRRVNTLKISGFVKQRKDKNYTSAPLFIFHVFFYLTHGADVSWQQALKLLSYASRLCRPWCRPWSASFTSPSALGGDTQPLQISRQIFQPMSLAKPALLHFQSGHRRRNHDEILFCACL